MRYFIGEKGSQRYKVLKHMPLEQFSTRPATAAARDIDIGLQTHMRHVYNIMTTGLVITTAAAWAIANVPALTALFLGTPLRIVFLLAPLGFVFFGFTHNRMMTMAVSKLRVMFFIFSALLGVSLALYFHAYTAVSVTRAFLTTTCMFLAMSLYGTVTKRNLAGVGSFMIMGFVGVFIAGIVNFFLHSSMLTFVVSCVGVICMLGLTAWETQLIRMNYRPSTGTDYNERMAYAGALGLYMNFINLLMFMMNLMGDRR